jgi:hypothetical protein
VAERAKIIYADGDANRTQKMTNALMTAGYDVFPCSGRLSASPLEKFVSPDLVLLHEEVSALQTLVETLWPGVPYEIVKEAQDGVKLIVQVESALRKSRSQ